MRDLFSVDARRDPYPYYERIRRGGPLVHDAALGLWLVVDWDGVKRVLDDVESFASSLETVGRRSPRWLIFLDPPRHARLRALITRAFTPRVVAALEPRIRAIATELLDRSIPRGEMDLANDFAVPLPLLVIAELIGVPVADRPRFKAWSEAILGLSLTVASGAPSAEALAAYAAAHAEMDVYVRARVADRRRAPQDDLLSHLVAAEVDGERLGHDDVLGFFELLVVGGTETTTNLVDNAVLCFLDHPDALARVRAAPALLPVAIEEVLRWRSPFQWTLRGTRREVTLHGRTLPAGALVLAAIGAANRDPARFPDADRFDVAREPNPHLAFGHGVHFCLGAALARLEARIALEELLARVDDLAHASDAPWEPRAALHVHGPTHLPVRFVARR